MENIIVLSALAAFVCQPSAPPPKWERLLDSDSFWVREKATKRLEKDGTLQECRCLLCSKSPEVRRRVRCVYEYKRAVLLDSLAPFPCIDALWYDIERHSYRYDWSAYKWMEPYIRNIGWDYEGPAWESWRRPTRIWAGDLIDAGVPISVIRGVFWEMHRRDRDFFTHLNYKFAP